MPARRADLSARTVASAARRGSSSPSPPSEEEEEEKRQYSVPAGDGRLKTGSDHQHRNNDANNSLLASSSSSPKEDGAATSAGTSGEQVLPLVSGFRGTCRASEEEGEYDDDDDNDDDERRQPIDKSQFACIDTDIDGYYDHGEEEDGYGYGYVNGEEDGVGPKEQEQQQRAKMMRMDYYYYCKLPTGTLAIIVVVLLLALLVIPAALLLVVPVGIVDVINDSIILRQQPDTSTTLNESSSSTTTIAGGKMSSASVAKVKRTVPIFPAFLSEICKATGSNNGNGGGGVEDRDKCLKVCSEAACCSLELVSDWDDDDGVMPGPPPSGLLGELCDRQHNIDASKDDAADECERLCSVGLCCVGLGFKESDCAAFTDEEAVAVCEEYMRHCATVWWPDETTYEVDPSQHAERIVPDPLQVLCDTDDEDSIVLCDELCYEVASCCWEAGPGNCLDFNRATCHEYAYAMDIRLLMVAIWKGLTLLHPLQI